MVGGQFVSFHRILFNDSNLLYASHILLSMNSEATIMGNIKTSEEIKDYYQVDEVDFTDNIQCRLEQFSSNGGTVLLMKGKNSDSGKEYNTPNLSSRISCDIETLFPILAECRVTKSKMEIDLIRYCTEITSLAHAYTMARTKVGMYEYQSESLFRHFIYYNFGSRHVGYTSICGCGPNAAVLHYGHAGAPNDRKINSGDICLFDMGAEYFCYGSDVTCSFPVGGKFTDTQRVIYQGVLDAQIAVYNLLRPGVSYVDCHKAAEAAILKSLVKVGIVITGTKTIEELVEMRLCAYFMPHGLGHLIGIDTHDVGGYLPGNPQRIDMPGLKSLRMARELMENMTLTVEPGCYFIDHLINDVLSEESEFRSFLNHDILNSFRGFGGIRLEDVVLITKDGFENLTICPRTIEEVEAVVNGSKWPPLHDMNTALRRRNLTKSMFSMPTS